MYCFCSFLPDIERAVESMREWDNELSDEVMKSMTGSLEFIHAVLGDMCEEPEEEVCVPPPTEETRACDVTATGGCYPNMGELMQTYQNILATEVDQIPQETILEFCR